MNWEYKRVLHSVTETINRDGRTERKKYDKRGRIVSPEETDTVERLFNTLGSEGWLLVTAVNLDSGVDSSRVPVDGVIEYIFKRET